MPGISEGSAPACIRLAEVSGAPLKRAALLPPPPPRSAGIDGAV